MDQFRIETAQNIEIQQNVAHPSTRVGSYLIDLVIIIAYIIVVSYISGALNIAIGIESWAMTLLLFLPVMFYSLLFEVFLNGQTPGKFANKIRVVKVDGSKPTFGSYLLRWLLRIIDFNLATGSVALLTILLNGKGQRLGDIAAGTTVISEKKRIFLKDTIAESLEENYQPTFPQVNLLSDNDIRTIKQLYQEAKRKRNHKIILKLSIKITEITGIKTTLSPMEFVDVVIKDYYYYAQA